MNHMRLLIILGNKIYQVSNIIFIQYNFIKIQLIHTETCNGVFLYIRSIFLTTSLLSHFHVVVMVIMFSLLSSL